MERIDHAQAFLVIERHGLFDEARLAGRGNFEGEAAVTGRRRCHVDSVNVGIVDEVVGAVVGVRHAVPACIVVRLGRVAAHDGHERRSVRLLEPGSALDLGYVAASDDAPANRRHIVKRG